MNSFDINTTQELAQLIARATTEHLLFEENLAEGIKSALKQQLEGSFRNNKGFADESVNWMAIAGELGLGQSQDIKRILTKMAPRIVEIIINSIDFNNLMKSELEPNISETRYGFPKNWQPLLG